MSADRSHGTLMSTKNLLARSTGVATRDRPPSPTTRAPSQDPGTARSSTTAHRSPTPVTPRPPTHDTRPGPVRDTDFGRVRSPPRAYSYNDAQTASCDTHVPSPSGRS